jgi:CRISPR-associated protein Cmr6
MLGQSEKSLPDLNKNIPIYRITTKPEFNTENSNAGLWYDKFCDTWLGLTPFNDKEIGFGDDGKRAWIGKITKDKIGNKELLKEMLLRREELTNARNGKVVLFQAQGPFVTGLGRTHPIENGFSFHHTIGVPYLAGSSVKGLVRAWAECWTEGKVSKEDIKRIFGDNDGVGSVIFLDAFPTEPVELKMDIMTPHYMNYYKGEEVPGDWEAQIRYPLWWLKKGRSSNFA